MLESFILNMAAPQDRTRTVLQALYNRAHAIDMEFTASSYWQARFQADFPMKAGFACLCEQSPDDNDRTRLDQIIYKVNSQSLMLTQLLIVESKRHGSGNEHIRKAEHQALQGSIRALKHNKLPLVYSITTWRTSFRAWVLYRNEQSLTTVDGGSNTFADKTSYQDIEKAADMYQHFISLVYSQSQLASTLQPVSSLSQPSTSSQQ